MPALFISKKGIMAVPGRGDDHDAEKL